jgi:hypothetical protein
LGIGGQIAKGEDKDCDIEFHLGVFVDINQSRKIGFDGGFLFNSSNMFFFKWNYAMFGEISIFFVAFSFLWIVIGDLFPFRRFFLFMKEFSEVSIGYSFFL